jgi:ATP phosphoribosyltransferase
MTKKIKIAIPSKGRLREPSIKKLENAGIFIKESSRSYIAATNDPKYDIVFARAFDVPVYVYYGAVDLGMAGYDIILEREVDVFELLDLNFGKCKLVIATPEKSANIGIMNNSIIPRVVTEFPNISYQYFEGLGKQAEILTVRGSVELAPRLGLADLIMDITETGETLRKNGLTILDTVLETSCRLICNKVSYRVHEKEINELISKLSAK